MKKARHWFIYTLLPGSLLLATTAAAQPPCDPTLTPEDNPSIQYRQRGGDLRCEGFYRANVSSGSSLGVVGLLQRPLRFGTGNELLRIDSPVQDKRVLVRGQGIPVKLYYRLDAELAPGGAMRWPARLLREQGIGPQRIGLYGRLADQPDWYVPLDIAGNQPPAEQPRLLLRAAVDIEEVLWRHAAVSDGRCGTMTGWKELAAPAGGSPAARRFPSTCPKLRSGNFVWRLRRAPAAMATG